ncbi:MAG: signal peptidase I [Candidatus Hadarchaeum sp.]|uniref:signal peptidase I n=1 Tax=Candidatus Hadarchaeum sp. TaxID=2883567 RepID=UPI003D1271F8
MFDKKTAAIFVLVLLVAVVGVGWRLAESRYSVVQTLPEDVENWTHIFRGYEAYLDKKIHYSVVSGSSMEPTLKDGDLVLWVEVDNTFQFRVGDIIIYQHPTRPYLDNIVHRIIEVGSDYRENQFKTKGDNSPEEYWVPRANIHGLVIGVIYRNGSR